MANEFINNVNLHAVFVHTKLVERPFIENIPGCEKVLEIYNYISRGTHSTAESVATSHLSNADEEIIIKKQIKTWHAGSMNNLSCSLF